MRELIFLGYRDSGMAGTPENADPRAYVNVPADEVVPRLVGIIRRVRPQVVITFEPNGGYGHPDHIAIHHHTVAAFHAAADGTRYPEQGPAWQAPRLFYTAIPRSFFLRMRDEMIALGMDTSGFARFEEGGGGGWPDEQVNVVMDVADAVEAKWSALELSPHPVRAGQPLPASPGADRQGDDAPGVLCPGVARPGRAVHFPSSYLADLSGPLQLHHGTADESVPTEFSQTLYQQAQAAKLSVPVEYYEYPGDNHNLSKSFNTAMQRSIAFFDKYVKNAAQPAAAATN